MSGFGRGGRGAALLKALEQPIRRPGQPPSPDSPPKDVPLDKVHIHPNTERL